MLEQIKSSAIHLYTRLLRIDVVKKGVLDESPLRSELFSSIQMTQYGRTLASRHTLTHKQSSLLLLSRLTENEDVLIATHVLLTEAVKLKRLITPAGVWLLDNFYLIEEQIRTAKRHLPKSYHRGLLQNSN